ncbi:MAG: DUF4156 domain-containing protein [Gammaproteobacteria bacterium]|jgi:hypothetical protein|nr:DUF4156 domain-containing protein [Gammaproteobacteria bacterium]NBT43527.1 DUF4156 domain-containing protein [Gammaproteobacteria bacterium]NBY23323.1 DUF4156 domain-containing protein [Gammaproteobacteria bacterium]
MKRTATLSLSVLLLGCVANPLNPGAEKVEVMTTPREVKKCTFIGDVSGSQGNRFSGTFTSNENLLLGARHAIKNEAARLGGNAVLIQQQQYSQHELSGGTANATLVGKAYRCGT